MRVRILGSAAGGGLPQWNCGCTNCQAARQGGGSIQPRMTCSVAVTVDGKRWFLFNAAPDVAGQLSACPGLWPRTERDSPVQAVLLSDAELDHVVGLLSLRQAMALDVYGTDAVRGLLADGCRLLPTLADYLELRWHRLTPGVPVPLVYQGGSPAGLLCEAFDVSSGKPPRYAGPDVADVGLAGLTVGYRVGDERTGGTLVYLPSVARLSAELVRQPRSPTLLLLDGTFWSDDELVQLDPTSRTARAMGHVPIDGPDGSLAWATQLDGVRTVYTHLNNTNPLLRTDSPERRMVHRLGVEVAADGAEYEL